MKGATEFLHQVQNDLKFIKRAQACTSDKARRAFLRQEGFEFTPEEWEAALRSWGFFDGIKHDRAAGELRKARRFDVCLKITELNGRPLDDAVILDISAWGAKLESMVSLAPESPVELTFPLPGADGQNRVRLHGRVVWTQQIPISKRHRVGVEFYRSLEELNHEGAFPLDKVKSAVQKQHEEISQKEFLSIKEFASKIGVHWFTVWRWTVEKRIQFKQVKSGCKIFIPASELLQFHPQAK